MNDLDNPASYSADPEDFLGVVEAFPDQVREGWRIGMTSDGLPSSDDIANVLVLGMGGSGVSGDVLRAVAGPVAKVPFHVSKGYALPTWVGPSTLIFAASYSGNTEETLAAFDAAITAGARIVSVTTGGALAERASAAGLPVISIPAGLQPRAALGYLAMPALAITQRLGICPSFEADIEDALETLANRVDEFQRKVLVTDNAAKQMAQTLLGKVPIIYGSEGIAEVAAYRWKCQLNECAKVPSWWHSFAELNHNEVVGWAQLKDVTSTSTAVVILRHESEHPRISKRIEVTKPIISEHVSSVTEVRASGASALARFLDLVYAGDFVATYLALLEGVDPTPVDVITSLKNKLAEN